MNLTEEAAKKNLNDAIRKSADGTAQLWELRTALLYNDAVTMGDHKWLLSINSLNEATITDVGRLLCLWRKHFPQAATR